MHFKFSIIKEISNDRNEDHTSNEKKCISVNDG